MTKLRNRVESLEQKAQFTLWFHFSRFLEALTDEQIEEIAINWRFPDPLPDPLPIGMSRLDGLDKESLLRLWEKEEREISRIMHEIRDRNEEHRRFHLHHGQWPEQA